MNDGPSSIHLLRNTTYLLSLARRAALASADADQRQQAIQLGPVLRELKGLTRAVERLQPEGTHSRPASARADAGPPSTPAGATRDEQAHTGILAQDDFQTLLTVSRQQRDPTGGPTEAPLSRTNVALGMAEGGASEVEIARALGLSRGEVDLILSVASQKR